jgi:hypothetical protein
MPWTESVEQMSSKLLELTEAVETYQREITELYEQAKAAGHTEQSLKVWSWHMDLVREFVELVEGRVQDMLISVAEHDYEMRRPNIDDIFI